LDRLEGKSEEYTPEDLAFRVQMTKGLEQYGKTIPQHVRAALILKDAGYDVPAGTIVEYVKTKGNEGVLPVQIAREQGFWLDKDKYIDTLRSVFEQVLDSASEVIARESLKGFIGDSITSTAIHAKRRAKEMEEAIETLDNVGINPVMSIGTKEIFEEIASLGLDEIFQGQVPDSFHKVLEIIAERISSDRGD